MEPAQWQKIEAESPAAACVHHVNNLLQCRRNAQKFKFRIKRLNIL